MHINGEMIFRLQSEDKRSAYCFKPLKFSTDMQHNGMHLFYKQLASGSEVEAQLFIICNKFEDSGVYFSISIKDYLIMTFLFGTISGPKLTWK